MTKSMPIQAKFCQNQNISIFVSRKYKNLLLQYLLLQVYYIFKL